MLPILVSDSGLHLDAKQCYLDAKQQGKYCGHKIWWWCCCFSSSSTFSFSYFFPPSESLSFGPGKKSQRWSDPVVLKALGKFWGLVGP